MPIVQLQNRVLGSQAVESEVRKLLLQVDDISVADLIRRAVEEQWQELQVQSATTVQEQVERAQRAFEKRHYLIMVNDRRVNSLDEMVVLTSSTKIVFLRLTPLVGG